MRLADTLGPRDTIVSKVHLQSPGSIVTIDGEYSNHPIYVGHPGKQLLDAICFRGGFYVDAEAIPFSADYAPEDIPIGKSVHKYWIH